MLKLICETRLLRVSLVIFLLLFCRNSFGQNTIIKPNQGVKSHKTLILDKIEITSGQTIIYLTITNEKQDGAWFCASKNIYLKNSLGTQKYSLQKSANIPICPQSHEFKKAGEKLSFILYFPKISDEIKYLDLVEECEEACFSFGGIILNKEFNTQLEKAFNLYSQRKNEQAIEIFTSLTQKYPEYNYGFIYYSIYLIYNEMNNRIEKEKWINKVKNSNFSDKNYYLNLIK